MLRGRYGCFASARAPLQPSPLWGVMRMRGKSVAAWRMFPLAGVCRRLILAPRRRFAPYAGRIILGRVRRRRGLPAQSRCAQPAGCSARKFSFSPRRSAQPLENKQEYCASDNGLGARGQARSRCDSRPSRRTMHDPVEKEKRVWRPTHGSIKSIKWFKGALTIEENDQGCGARLGAKPEMRVGRRRHG